MLVYLLCRGEWRAFAETASSTALLLGGLLYVRRGGSVTLVALIQVIGRPFEAALLDHQMPGMSGAELGATIVQDADLKATRLILLTPADQGAARSFAEIVFAGYLLKPVAQRDLQRSLRLAFGDLAERPSTPSRSPSSRAASWKPAGTRMARN
jgi:CheY-like chemotaxis protein